MRVDRDPVVTPAAGQHREAIYLRQEWPLQRLANPVSGSPSLSWPEPQPFPTPTQTAKCGPLRFFGSFKTRLAAKMANIRNIH